MKLFIIFILFLQALIFFGHWFLYKSINGFFNLTSNSKKYLKIFLFLASLSFLIASFWIHFDYNAFSRYFYILAASWMGIFYFLGYAVILTWISYAILKLKKSPYQIKKIAIFFLLLSGLASAYSLINCQIIRTTSIDVNLPKLPQEWQNKKAVFISDLHLGNFNDVRFAEKVVAKINSMNPDIVFIGGDYYDGTAVDAEKLASPIKKLRPSFGTYFVTGNHEEFRDKKFFTDALEKNGVNILNNELREVQGLQLLGVGYLETRKQENYQRVLANIEIDNDKPSILLRHSPFYLDLAEKKGVDLELSGHTHNGQLFPANLIARYIFSGYEYGLKEYGTMKNYTTSGAGIWGIPMRLGSISEIVLINFK